MDRAIRPSLDTETISSKIRDNFLNSIRCSQDDNQHQLADKLYNFRKKYNQDAVFAAPNGILNTTVHHYRNLDNLLIYQL
jgi:hypothetical protein